MNIDLKSIEDRIAGSVTQAFEARDVPHYPYHNLLHTQDVVARVREIGAYYSLEAREFFILSSAAWFHDIGHLYGGIEGHEERGVVIMQQYLSNIPKELREAIAVCIMATRLPSHPITLVEKIICDADTYHLGTPVFRQTDPLVRQEMELRKEEIIENWECQTLEMLRRHVFFTDYCQILLAKGKEENILWMQARLAGD
jgi:predicted metal-dependent HD superfamily phosphohydrolase